MLDYIGYLGVLVLFTLLGFLGGLKISKEHECDALPLATEGEERLSIKIKL
jgi:hypothetical protein